MEANYRKIIDNLPSNAKLAIWGTSDIAKTFYNLITSCRNDVDIKYFITSYESNAEDDNIKIISSIDFIERAKEIDSVIITSYSGKEFINTVTSLLKIKNVYNIDESFIKTETEYCVEDTKQIFSTDEDRDLFELLSNFRANKKSFEKELYRHYILNNPKIIAGYAQNHYFDFINKNAIKTVFDLGGYDCYQSLLFLNRFPNCKKIYTFEPCYETFKKPFYDAMVKRFKEIEIVKKGVWNKTDCLEFRKENDAKDGSAITEVKPAYHKSFDIIKIPVISIDEFVKERNIEKVDFIKMDIENAEKDAIEGGSQTILKDRPQMAVSIYHSQEQFYNLPKYLNKVLSDYTFRLGHYSQGALETVLYAIPNELL